MSKVPDLNATLADVEAWWIFKIYRAERYNVSRAARRLGIHVRTLRKKLRRLETIGTLADLRTVGDRKAA